MLETLAILGIIYLKYKGIIKLRWVFGALLVWGIFLTLQDKEETQALEQKRAVDIERMMEKHRNDPDNARLYTQETDYDGPPAGYTENKFPVPTKKELELSNEIHDAMENGY